MSLSKQLRELVASDKLEAALERLAAEALEPDQANEVTALRGAIQHTNNRVRTQTISEPDATQSRARARAALLSLLSEIERSPLVVNAHNKTRSVFICCGHADTAAAVQLSEVLQSRNIGVVADATHRAASESITDFVRRSIAETTATVLIVSTASLSSEWAIFEVISAIGRQELDVSRRLIACSTDDGFTRPEFRLDITETIDDRLSELDKLIADYLLRRLDLTDLSAERTRLLKMKGNLGDVLDRLKATPTLSLEPGSFDSTTARVVDHILQLAS